MLITNEIIKFAVWDAKNKGIPFPEQHAINAVTEYIKSIPKVDESKIPSSMTIFTNGNVIVFDKNGEQMGELQENVDNFFLEFLELKGIDPTKIEKIRKTVNRKHRLFVPFKKDNGEWNGMYKDDND